MMESNPGLGATLVVVVVYKRPWQQVHAACWLESALTGMRVSDGTLMPRLGRVLIYDNSPQSMARPAGHPENLDYIHDPTNGGTRAAYAGGLALARRFGLSWVILLDHDTTVSGEYFDELDAKLVHLTGRQVGLLFPRVVGNRGVLSPAVINRWGSIVPFDTSSQLPRRGIVTAVASGAVIRADALSGVGEIPPTLWLDYLDHWLFRKVQCLGFGVEFLSSTIRHDLSIQNAEVPSSERLSNMLRGEQFLMGVLGVGARAVYPIRLLARAVKVLPRDKRAAWLIFRHIFQVQLHR